MLQVGFQGDFFGPEDVEFFLRQKGIVIPAGADLIEIKVDTKNFQNSDGTTGPLDTSPWQGSTPRLSEMCSRAVDLSLYMPQPHPSLDDLEFMPHGARARHPRVAVNVDLLARDGF